MDSINIKKKLIQKAKDLRIDKIGFASADPFVELKERLINREINDYGTSFEEQDIKKRVDPSLSLSNAKTIVAIALAYPTKLKNPPVSKVGQYRGIFCRSSWGKDYHKVLTDKLTVLSDYLCELVPTAKNKVMVDTGSLSDRAVAERSGIGFSGKNTSIINTELGSWIYLGEFITNIYITPDKKVLDSCGDCTICIDSCPTGAIKEEGVLNSKACISYLTQTKGPIKEEYRKKIGNRLYGCDTCQVVCPKNKKINFDHHEEFIPEVEKAKPLLKPLLNLSNRQFKKKFKDISGAWRGRTPIQRNAIIGLAHFKDVSAVTDLIFLLNHDKRSSIRATAAWALGEIGGKDAYRALELAKLKDKDHEVIFEINKVLN